MKRIFFGSLSVLLVSTVTAPAVMAETKTEDSVVLKNPYSETPRMNAYNLVTSAYRGRFAKQGIPGYNKFSQAYYTEDIDAEKLVKSAIEADQLQPQALEKEEYLNAVKQQMENLSVALNR
jgi:hypothetical protein